MLDNFVALYLLLRHVTWSKREIEKEKASNTPNKAGITTITGYN